jgi:bifunctional DNA-binding transcriptional regulator/antitoxin component of YhaV-PrlF toxin-antitoxin module
VDNRTLRMAERGVITIPKVMRDEYDLQPGATFTLLDLGGVFVLSPRDSEIDALTDRIAKQWAQDGQSLESMLQALREERDRRAA